MLGRSFAVAIVAAALISVFPMGASAAQSGPAIHLESGDDETYTPEQHTVPSLDGSAVGSRCVDDRPYIGFSVVLTDPEGLVTTNQASLIMTDGTNTHTIKLGSLKPDGTLSGVVPWPGSENGGWPGWELVNGEWVETSGNFAWTRGPITASIHVNPDLPVALSYPPESALCANPPSDDPPPLAVTGSDFEPLPLLYAAGGLIVVGGLTLVLVRRRAANRR